MGAVRLGRMHLRWCDRCDLPLLEEKLCTRCGDKTHQVQVTPPGDVRPAFERELMRIRETIDSQFGQGCGYALIPKGKLVLLNKVPSLDRMDEVILDGEVVGALRYDLAGGWTFVMRIPAARSVQEVMTSGFVIADEGAIAPIAAGANLLAPGVVGVEGDVEVGDEVIIVTPSMKTIATGIAKMSAQQMTEARRGVAVKSRWASEPMPAITRAAKSGWEEVIQANLPVIKRRRDQAVSFITNTIEDAGLPAVVSFSGGKDSLACLLLTIDAGYSLPLFFLDTGLEFPETVEYVKRVAEGYSLDLIIERAPEGIFLDNLDLFGPPGRDYRWCCKTNKLGPVVKAIQRHFGSGVLSFIGQRRYESESRSQKPRVWRNPWTPGQLSASPIQDWTALHVWLYILSKKAPYNPWYERGLDRIGCYLCPASDLAELRTVQEEGDYLDDWIEFLRDYASSRGLPEEWVELGIWRWRRVPDAVRGELTKLGVELRAGERMNLGRGTITLHLQENYSPCTEGFRVVGAFSRPVELSRTANLLNLMGQVRVDSEGDYCEVGGVTLFGDGAVVARGGTPEMIRKKAETVRKVVTKALECVGCGICLGRCQKDALVMRNDQVTVVEERCTHCGRCLEPCPALSFGDINFEF